MSGWLVWALAAALAGEAGQVVVVRPAGWSDALQGWKAYRQSQGYQVLEVEPAASAEATRQRMADAIPPSTAKPKAVVLMADTVSYADRHQPPPADRVPTFYVESKVVKDYGSEPWIATDFPYGDLDGDGVCETAVGRIPASSRQVLEDYLQRVVAYPQTDLGEWQREIDIVAGVGDFGFMIDSVIEGVTRQLLTQDIPPAYRLSLTHTSPNSLYCPGPAAFRQSVVQRMNDGGLFWVYLGHGHVDSLDYFELERRPCPILEGGDLAMVAIPQGPPVAVMLACYLGAFDASRPCFAEQLLLKKDGPIAVIAASRVSMPYAMGVLGSELLRECFQLQTAEVGEILRSAKVRAAEDPRLSVAATDEGQAMPRELLDGLAKALSPDTHSLEEERREHGYLFNLLGDPLIQLSHPEALTFEVPEAVVAGSPLKLVGQSPFAGRLSAELAVSRTRVPDRVRELRNLQGATAEGDLILARYEAANELRCARCEIHVAAGAFEIELPIAAACRGKYQVHLLVEGDRRWAVGSRSVQISSEREP
jgi:hypothetical protein